MSSSQNIVDDNVVAHRLEQSLPTIRWEYSLLLIESLISFVNSISSCAEWGRKEVSLAEFSENCK